MKTRNVCLSYLKSKLKITWQCPWKHRLRVNSCRENNNQAHRQVCFKYSMRKGSLCREILTRTTLTGKKFQFILYSNPRLRSLKYLRSKRLMSLRKDHKRTRLSLKRQTTRLKNHLSQKTKVQDLTSQKTISKKKALWQKTRLKKYLIGTRTFMKTHKSIGVSQSHQIMPLHPIKIKRIKRKGQSSPRKYLWAYLVLLGSWPF